MFVRCDLEMIKGVLGADVGTWLGEGKATGCRLLCTIFTVDVSVGTEMHFGIFCSSIEYGCECSKTILSPFLHFTTTAMLPVDTLRSRHRAYNEYSKQFHFILFVLM